MRRNVAVAAVLVVFCLIVAVAFVKLGGFGYPPQASNNTATSNAPNEQRAITTNAYGYTAESLLANVPAYTGSISIVVNGNQPNFSDDDLTSNPFETYSPLDTLGRCGPAYALVGRETMPQSERGSIGMVKPSGWQLSKYDWIDGQYLFNRCHLIAFALSGENENELNLITGTRTMNVHGMLPYEVEVASYIDRTGNHVLYRVTPVFEGDNLVASGVLMEAKSAEDSGAGICFCVWCYNVEPGVVIDYATGDNRTGDPTRERYSDNPAARSTSADSNGSTSPSSANANSSSTSPSSANTSVTGSAEGESGASPSANADSTGSDSPSSASAGAAENAEGENSSADASTIEVRTYVLNTNTHRFHYPECGSVNDMSDSNKRYVEATRQDLISEGYIPCGSCKP